MCEEETPSRDGAEHSREKNRSCGCTQSCVREGSGMMGKKEEEHLIIH